VLHEQVAANPAQFVDVPLPITNPLIQGIGAIGLRIVRLAELPQRPAGDPVDAHGPACFAARLDNEITSTCFCRQRRRAPAGYPVVIFGHGFGDSQWGGPTAVAPTLAQAGFATIAINAVGHGFGPQSQVIITDPSGNVTTLTAGGRGVDLNGDGQIRSV
jgi:pimeloyl-ACP methyl ester carboxylesterase